MPVLFCLVLSCLWIFSRLILSCLARARAASSYLTNCAALACLVHCIYLPSSEKFVRNVASASIAGIRYKGQKVHALPAFIDDTRAMYVVEA